MSPVLAASSEARAAAAMRLARSIAFNLMSQRDVSSLRWRGGFEPERLVRIEVERLVNRTGCDAALRNLWEFLDEAAERDLLRGLVPLSERPALSKGLGTEWDPFVGGLLRSDEDLEVISEPQIHGTNPRADNPRKAIWPTGEFAKRDLGTLPTELGRLAPNELVLIHRGMRNNHDGDISSENGLTVDDQSRPGFRTYFLFRVVQGSLLQRFSQTSRNAAMEPLARVQVDIIDDPDLHRLADPPAPPRISWYRALAIEIFHQFAQLSIPFKWDTEYAIGYSSGELYTASVLDKRHVPRLALSRESAFEAVAERCPPAFSAGWKPFEPAQLNSAGWCPKFDFWLRIVLGTRRRTPRQFPTSLKVRADYNQGFRIELERSRNWGIAVSAECESVEEIEMPACDKPETSPKVAARVILGSALRLQWEEDVLLNAR